MGDEYDWEWITQAKADAAKALNRAVEANTAIHDLLDASLRREITDDDCAGADGLATEVRKLKQEVGDDLIRLTEESSRLDAMRGSSGQPEFNSPEELDETISLVTDATNAVSSRDLVLHVVVEEIRRVAVELKTTQRLADIANSLAVYGQEYGSIQSPRLRNVTPVEKMTQIEYVRDLDVRSQLVTLGFFDLGRVVLGYTHTDATPGSADELFQELGQAGDALVHKCREAARPATYLDANFCAFACWAAVTIGQPIRNRFAPRRLDNNTPNMVRGLASRLAIDVRQTNGQRLSLLLSEAQMAVFIDVRTAFVRLLDLSTELEAALDEKIEWAISKSGSDSPPRLPQIESAAVALAYLDQCEKHLSTLAKVNALATERRSGRDLTPRYQSIQHGMISLFLARYAFKHCHDAVKHKVRSELIFRSTLLIESYIQTVVQTVLTYSVDELAREYFDQRIGIESSESRGAGRWRRRFNRTVQNGFDRRLDEVWSRFLTDQILVARIGDEVIRLGRDIPDPPGNYSGFFPAVLRDIDDQWTHNLLLRFDHSFGAGVGTRSFKWGDYDDRMNFMTNLFRSRQTAIGVWKEPFTLHEEIQVRIGLDPTEGASLPWMR